MGELSLIVGGVQWRGWKEVRVSAGLTRAARDFDVSVTERWPGQGDPLPLHPGQACEVRLDDEPVLTGWIDTDAPDFSSSTHGVRIAGRSRTADLVDCAALVRGGQFKNYDLVAISRALAAPFKVGVEVEVPVGAAFADVQVQPGETCFELIERLCRLRAVLASDDARGNLVLTRAGAGGRGRAEALVQGTNILSASAVRSHAERFSDYRVRGQQAGTDNLFGTQASQPAAHVKDATITRHRPMLVIAEAQGSGATFRDRAIWERSIAAARGASASVTVRGWRQSTGNLWSPGFIVPVRSSWLRLERDMLIEAVEYRKDVQGEYATLTLVAPEALTPEPASTDPAEAPAGGERNRVWDIIPIDQPQS